MFSAAVPCSQLVVWIPPRLTFISLSDRLLGYFSIFCYSRVNSPVTKTASESNDQFDIQRSEKVMNPRISRSLCNTKNTWLQLRVMKWASKFTIYEFFHIKGKEEIRSCSLFCSWFYILNLNHSELNTKLLKIKCQKIETV